MSVFPLRRLVFPFLLIIAAVLLRNEVNGLEPVYQQLLDGLPYVTLCLTLALSVYYNRARIFTVTCVLLLIYYLIQTALQTALSDPWALILYSAISVFLPVTVFWLLCMPERGLRNRYGVLVFSILPLLLILAVVLLKYFPQTELLATINTWLPIKPTPDYVLSMNASMGFAMIALAGLVKLSQDDNEYTAALTSVLVISFITLARLNLPHISVAMFSTAGVILIISLLRSAYDMAYRDELTGLLGRRALNERLKGLGRRYVIAMMDVDHFKKFNDTYGHDVGDDVLKIVAKQIAVVKGGGIPYRYGGEEFSIIFPGKEIEECKPHLEAVRKAVEAYQMVLRHTRHRPNSGKEASERRGRRAKIRGNETVSVTISIGAAEPGAKHSKVDDVLKAADKALYKAKQDGRNCLAI